MVISGLFCILADRTVLKRPGYAGAAVASSAGNSVATPAAVAMVDPSWQPYVAQATAAAGASVVITAILVPILTTWACANNTVQRIAQQLPGAVGITHQHGCSQFPIDGEQTKRTLVGFGTNPNVGACIVVGLGCENVQPQEVAAGIAKSGKPVACIVIQEAGGTINAVSEGVRIGRKMLADLSLQEKEEHDLSEIILGLECGGSDTTSGIAANPAVGVASDLLVEHGGTAILSETQELIGAEHLLAERAVSQEVAKRVIEIVKRAEESAFRMGEDIRLANPSPGNKKGGLSTLEEKSLGCVHKAGLAPVQEVIEYAYKPTKKGLVIMDTPGNDIESITGMAAGGAQIIVFTTGRGTPTACPIAPTIKVCGNGNTCRTMEDNIDISAAGIIEGTSTVREVGERIFAELVEVCRGKLTKAEQLGFGDFGINRIGPTQ